MTSERGHGAFRISGLVCRHAVRPPIAAGVGSTALLPEEKAAKFKFESALTRWYPKSKFVFCSYQYQRPGERQMPRIPREEQATIRHRVDVEGQKVADVAAAYGCTPANIYAILAKLRRQDVQNTGEVVSSPSVAAAAPTPVPAVAAVDDLFGALAEADPAPAAPAVMVPVAPEPPAPVNDKASPSAAAASDLSPARLPSPIPTRSGRVGAASKSSVPAPPPRPSKAGYALLMRTSDGEEAVNPFRSLDELLAATKPILRTAARSPEPIWFSIQQVDLEALEDSF
jgi:hypothetical protein